MHGKSFSDQTVYAIPFFHTAAHSNSTEMYKLLFPRCERTPVRPPCAHLLLCVALSSYLYCCNFILMLEYSFLCSHSAASWKLSIENANWCEPAKQTAERNGEVYFSSYCLAWARKNDLIHLYPHSIGQHFWGFWIFSVFYLGLALSLHFVLLIRSSTSSSMHGIVFILSSSCVCVCAFLYWSGRKGRLRGCIACSYCWAHG